MMAEIVTGVRCGQWVHDRDNGRVCAERRADDLAEEEREGSSSIKPSSMRST